MTRWSGQWCTWGLGLLLAYDASATSVLGAQGAPGPTTGAATEAANRAVPAIDPAELRRHISVLTHDSMGGRNTPSVGLERTARYVVAQFQALGLKPAGEPATAPCVVNDSIPWLQRYPVPGTLRASPRSTVRFTVRLSRAGASIVDGQGQLVDRVMWVSFDTAARFAVDTLPESGGRNTWAELLGVQAQTRVLAGRQTPGSVTRAALPPGGVVLYVPPDGGDPATERAVIRQLATMSHVVVLAAEDSATFAARRAAAFARPPVVVDSILEGGVASLHWAAYVWPGALANVLEAARLDLAALRANMTPRVVTVPGIGIALRPVSVRASQDTATAMNAAAILPGTDTLLRKQCIVIAAHMDHIGRTPGQADSIANGADDNASGVAGLLALAKAFRQPGARPKRPIVFVATSGGANDKHQWGANAYAAPASNDVIYSLNLTLDMLGCAHGDSLLVDGLSDFDFATRPDWVATQHPELGVRLVDGGTVFGRAGDQLAFLQRRVPALYIHASDHGEPGGARADRPGAAAAGAPEAVDVECEARSLRLVYFMTQDLANAARLPHWTSASRERWTRLFGR